MQIGISVPDEGYIRNESYELTSISKFYYYRWVDTSAGGYLVLGSIIRPVVTVSVLSWFIRYICSWGLQFLNIVIIMKAKVLFPQAWMTLRQLWLSCLCHLVYLLHKSLELFVYPIFWLWAYLMKINSGKTLCVLNRYIYVFNNI
jgi:hypothetical protein